MRWQSRRDHVHVHHSKTRSRLCQTDLVKVIGRASLFRGTLIGKDQGMVYAGSILAQTQTLGASLAPPFALPKMSRYNL